MRSTRPLAAARPASGELNRLYDMTKGQTQSLVTILLIVLGTTGLAWVAYSQHRLRSEEGLVYLGLFQPNPDKVEFRNVIAFSRPSVCDSSEPHYLGFPQDVVSEFLEANDKEAKPIRLVALEGEVPIVSWEDTKRLHGDGLAAFFRPQEHRLLSLSRVGFNGAMNEAIVCVEISEDSSGPAVLYYLKKRVDAWDIVEARKIWIS